MDWMKDIQCPVQAYAQTHVELLAFFSQETNNKHKLTQEVPVVCSHTVWYRLIQGFINVTKIEIVYNYGEVCIR